MAKQTDSTAIRLWGKMVVLSVFRYGISLVVLVFMSITGCASPAARARLVQENLHLHEDKQRLERTVARQTAEMAALQKQVENLQQFGSEQPADLFAPVRIEIGRMSGGANVDGESGDDGVKVYLRLRDADGDPVKVPGRITIRLTDDSDIPSPRVLGLCTFEGPDDLRSKWLSRFGTQHFALYCPFPPNVRPATDKVTVHAEFTDYLTGRTLRAVGEVGVSMSSPALGTPGSH